MLSADIDPRITDAFRAYGQGHVLRHLDALAPRERAAFLEQLAEVDLALMAKLVAGGGDDHDACRRHLVDGGLQGRRAHRAAEAEVDDLGAQLLSLDDAVGDRVQRAAAGTVQDLDGQHDQQLPDRHFHLHQSAR